MEQTHMKVKELIQLLQECDPNQQIKMEDYMHDLHPICGLVKNRMVHEDKNCYVIALYEYNETVS